MIYRWFFNKFIFFILLNNIPTILSSNIKIDRYSNEEIKQINFGSLLGDGKLELSSRAVNARFGFIQSQKFQDYFLHLNSIFSVFCSSSYRTYTYKDPRTKKEYTNLNFWTKSLPIFTEFYKLFYSQKIKIVPQDLSLLTPLALAHWIFVHLFI